jgi:energy-coupling factor transport system permease protein
MRFLYTEKDTFVHRMSPQAKLGAMLISFVLPVAFNHPLYLVAIACVALLYAGAAQAWDMLFRFRRLLLILVVVSWVLWALLLRQGDPILQVGPAYVSELSLTFGLAMGLRLTTYVAMGLIFLSATSIEELTAAFRSLGLPFSLGFALSTSFRLVPTFIDTTRAVSEAQRARGLDLEHGNPIRRARRHLPLFVPIIASCIRRANSMAMALEARGFGSSAKRTSYRGAKIQRREWLVLVVLAALAVAAIILRIMGYGVLVPGRL